MSKIHLELTPEQAAAVCDALDAYARLCLGQLENVVEQVRFGCIPMFNPSADGEPAHAPVEVCETLDLLMYQAKAAMGYPSNGSHGIGHPHVHVTGRRAYEVKKALAKVVAEHRNPAPDFCTVDYDGLGPRYTNDPAPRAFLK